jgi:hypothetical protein
VHMPFFIILLTEETKKVWGRNVVWKSWNGMSFRLF